MRTRRRHSLDEVIHGEDQRPRVFREDGKERSKAFYIGGGGRSGQTAFKARTALRYALRLPEDDGELPGDRADGAIEVDIACVARRIGFGVFMAVHGSARHLPSGMSHPGRNQPPLPSA